MLEDCTVVKLQMCSAHDKGDVIHCFVSQSVDEAEGLRWLGSAWILAEGGL